MKRWVGKPGMCEAWRCWGPKWVGSIGWVGLERVRSGVSGVWDE